MKLNKLLGVIDPNTIIEKITIYHDGQAEIEYEPKKELCVYAESRVYKCLDSKYKVQNIHSVGKNKLWIELFYGEKTNETNNC